jgi:hypothetical protein
MVDHLVDHVSQTLEPDGKAWSGTRPKSSALQNSGRYPRDLLRRQRGGRKPLGPVPLLARTSSSLHRSDSVSFLRSCALPYRRFADTLADTGARLGADADRYSFIAVDSHHLHLAGFTGARNITLHPDAFCRLPARRGRGCARAKRRQSLRSCPHGRSRHQRHAGSRPPPSKPAVCAHQKQR